MDNLTVMRSFVTRIENILKELKDDKFSQIQNLDQVKDDFSSLKKKIALFKKIVNGGKATPELKKKLIELKKWVMTYRANPSETILAGMPKKLQNKNLSVDHKVFDHFAHNAELAIEFMLDVPVMYSEIINATAPMLSMGELFDKHIGMFDLKGEDIPDADLLFSDDVELIEAMPAAMVRNVRSILKEFDKYAMDAKTSYNDIMETVNRLSSVNLESIFALLNDRNTLIQALFKNLMNVNRALYEGKFKLGAAMRKEYFDLLHLCLNYLPKELAEQVRMLAGSYLKKSKLEEEVARSVGGVRGREPGNDPGTIRNSPFVKLPEKKIEKAQTPIKDVAPGKNKNGLSDEEKRKYEALWD